jgi:hypothetical protein
MEPVASIRLVGRATFQDDLGNEHLTDHSISGSSGANGTYCWKNVQRLEEKRDMENDGVATMAGVRDSGTNFDAVGVL